VDALETSVPAAPGSRRARPATRAASPDPAAPADRQGPDRAPL